MVLCQLADITRKYNGKVMELVTAYIQELWQDSSQAKVISEEQYQLTNYETKILLVTIVPVSLGNIPSNFIWNNRASITWEWSCQFILGTNLNEFKLISFYKRTLQDIKRVYHFKIMIYQHATWITQKLN